MKNISKNQTTKTALTFFLIVSILFLGTTSLLAQEPTLTFDLRHVPLSTILKEVKAQSGKKLLFNNQNVDPYRNETLILKNSSLEKALTECLKGKDLQWRIVDDVIIIESSSEDQVKMVPPTQTIRGTVTDMNTGCPLTGANIILRGSEPLRGAVSNAEGFFELREVPVGRQSVEASFVGYNSTVYNNLYLTSGKEYVLTIKLEEKVIVGEEVTVMAYNRKDLPLNEMAQVGARSFSVEETERYAGSVGDPARMASSYAGVLTLGTQINDIVIRGNSTNALLWRMQGLRIPNPNHFGEMASTGGTVSMLNNNVLGNSDFYTGAFPAEFSDAQSGIFDLKLRKGNQETREYLAQIGFGGFEAGIEGPFKKGSHPSYIVNYRYSTMGVFDLLGLDIGVFAIPSYQDLSFNIDVPTKKAGKLSFFGLGGLNSISDQYYNPEEDKGDTTEAASYLGFTGVNHLFFFNENSSISTSFGISRTQNRTFSHLATESITEDFAWIKNNESTFEARSEYKNRINSRNYMKFGIDFFYARFDLRDSLYLTQYDIFSHTLDIHGDDYLLQLYGQWKHRFNEKLSLVGGVNYQYSMLGDDGSLEPRFSLKWDLSPKHSFSLGTGLFSKSQPRFIYYKEVLADTLNTIYEQSNLSLEMTRSKQIVLGYDYLINNFHRLKVEIYHQYLSNVPVEEDSSYLSLINYGSSFSVYDFGALVNKGTGYNYGVELTLERFLSKGLYYLFTLSLFESRYKGSDEILRSTRFNNNIITNFLVGYEWKTGDHNTMGFDLKACWAMGERKIPLDYQASLEKGDAVYVISEAYRERFRDYLRFDIRFYYRINKKTSHMLSIDIMNITNRQNHFLAMYDRDKNDYKEVSTLSIMPAFVWRWNF